MFLNIPLSSCIPAGTLRLPALNYPCPPPPSWASLDALPSELLAILHLDELLTQNYIRLQTASLNSSTVLRVFLVPSDAEGCGASLRGRDRSSIAVKMRRWVLELMQSLRRSQDEWEGRPIDVCPRILDEDTVSLIFIF